MYSDDASLGGCLAAWFKTETNEHRCQQSTKVKMASTSAALEGLPKQFVASMKTLFDVMDDRNSGYVKLTGIHLLTTIICLHVCLKSLLFVCSLFRRHGFNISLSLFNFLA